jgi:hypothetical protein
MAGGNIKRYPGKVKKVASAGKAGLAMTMQAIKDIDGTFIATNKVYRWDGHCEERSDEAISVNINYTI